MEYSPPVSGVGGRASTTEVRVFMTENQQQIKRPLFGRIVRLIGQEVKPEALNGIFSKTKRWLWDGDFGCFRRAGEVELQPPIGGPGLPSAIRGFHLVRGEGASPPQTEVCPTNLARISNVVRQVDNCATELIAQELADGAQFLDVVADRFEPRRKGDSQQQPGGVPQEAPQHQ